MARFTEGFDKKALEQSLYAISFGIKIDWYYPDVAGITSDSITSLEIIINELKQRENVVSCQPFYRTKDGVEMGLDNEILVRFLPDVTESRKKELQEKYGTKLVEQTYVFQVLSVPKDMDPIEIANLYYESGLTEFATPSFYNYIVLNQNQIIPNDTYFPYQITLNNTGQTINDGHTGTPDADIDAPEAWEISTGNSDVVVAVLDEGVTSDHPDLPNTRQVRLAGSDFYGKDGNPSPSGNNNHGNACAGVIAATMNNNQGIAGIAPDCKIMPIRIAKSDDIFVKDKKIAKAIEFAVDHGADILSNSWTYKSSDPNHILSIVSAIQYAVDHDRVVVFCAGNTADHEHNNNGYIQFPANVNIPGVITVGASDRYDHQANYSPTSDPQSPYNQMIDIVAPSHRAYPCNIDSETFEMWTIDIPGDAGNNSWHYQPEIDYCMNPPDYGEHLPSSGTNYLAYTGRFGGTSHSCPVVAGVAALMLSVNPDLSKMEIYDILISTADKVGGYDYILGRCDEMGYGRVNAYRALCKVKSDIMTISGPSYVCSSNATFTVQDAPPGSTATWSVSPGTRVTPGSGSGMSASFHMASCNDIGDVQITFNVSTPCGTNQVSTPTTVGGPDPQDVELDIYKSTGQHANKYGETWVLCPNENYEIFVINNSSCSTSNYTWILPYSLTKNYQNNNMVSVHTNSHPGGNIIVKAQTCCTSCGSNVQILSDYVGTDYNCGYGYMSLAPNPAQDEITVELKTGNIKDYKPGATWTLEIYNQQQALVKKMDNLTDTRQVINTSGLKAGVYYVRVLLGNNMYSGKFVIER